MARKRNPAGIIFDIIKYAVHDGPGIRTTVFLKGCPLRCQWCQNPESQKVEPERFRGVYGRKYSGLFSGEDKHTIGREVSVRQVISEVEKDRIFYDYSGGGVTFSGGEPLMQPGFLFSLLKESKKRGMQTAVDTSGYAPWSAFKRILGYSDLFLYDLKLMDDKEHIEYTGSGTDSILNNLRKLTAAGARVVARFPIIPGITDRPDNVRAVGSFLMSLKSIDTIHLLPYNYLCKDKYRRMSINYPLKKLEPPSNGELRVIGRILRDYGLKVKVRGTE
ncbi:MAG: glycyl-radical enzyme activating protein [candidate division WOR-3 bacterium]|nr:MAG: glycyl-radical enzyme activating protein [candidate division WOR-3 bacterium]